MSDYYRPGYRAGGPVRTLEAVASLLRDEFDFRIVTRDQDLGSEGPYPGVELNVWQAVGAAIVMYLSPDQLSALHIRRLIASTQHDLLYINSMFSVPFSIYPLTLRRLGLIPSHPLIVAPRGELSRGALDLKPRKKRAYVATSRLLTFLNGVLWQASSSHEARDIRRVFGAKSQVFVAPDLADARPAHKGADVSKERGRLRALFLGRVSRMKNLDGALRMLSEVEGQVELSIYGPVEDNQYWQQCERLISQLPASVRAVYQGEVAPERVGSVISDHDLLFLPTLGENYGHVILEALVCGRPVLISDRTRWRELEAAGVGWDIPLEEPEKFRRVLEKCVAMDTDEWRQLCEAAVRYGDKALNDPEARERNRKLFRSCLDRGEARQTAVQRPT